MLEAGQVLHDNDPRYRGRRVEVIRIEDSYAVCKCGPRQVKVRLHYIFTDGMPRRSGYSTVAPNDDSRGSANEALRRPSGILWPVRDDFPDEAGP
jgi:hypothetical protein